MKTTPDNKNIVSIKDTIPGKFIYWIDEKTDLLHNMETKRADWLMKEFSIHKWMADSKRILDIACGMGYITNYIADHTNSAIYGVDIVDYRTRYMKENTRFIYEFGDAYLLQYDDNYFDSVLMLVSLHHMWKPEEAVKEALRVLKPGGQLIILEDIITGSKTLQTRLTLFIDNLINLSFTKNPNTNKTKEEWEEILTGKFGLNLIEEYSIKWGFLNSLELGVFRLIKRESLDEKR